MTDGVRKHQREETNLTLVWASPVSGQAGRGRLLNMSLGGALIETDQRLTVGSDVVVVCAGLASLPPRAVVQWCQPLLNQPGFQSGVSFAPSAVRAMAWGDRGTL